MLALALLSIGNSKYGINSRNVKNANYGKKANNPITNDKIWKVIRIQKVSKTT